MEFTKEQLEKMARQIEAAEKEMHSITAAAVDNARGFTADENKRLGELKANREGLVEVLRSAQSFGKPSATTPAAVAQAGAATAGTSALAAVANPQADPDILRGHVIQVKADPRDEKPFGSAGEQLRAIAMSARGVITEEDRSRLHKVHNIHEHFRAASGMGEAIPSDGGFLLQKDFSNQLQAGMYETSLLLQQTTQMQLSSSSNGIEVLVLDETSRATGSRLGGVRVYWGNEADTVAATKPAMRMVKMELLKMFAACYVTEELLQDTSALESFLSSAFQNEMGFVIDDMIINGNGAGRPAGIMGAGNGCLVTVSKEGGQTADTFNFQNALKMRSRLPVRSRKNARWYINQEIETQLPQFTLLGGTSSPGIYIPGGSVVDGIPMDKLFGYPVQVLEQAAGIGDLGDVLFADLSQYLTISKGGLQQASSIHVRFMQGENTYRFMQRWNGCPLNNAPLTPYKGTATISPFVTLEAR